MPAFSDTIAPVVPEPPRSTVEAPTDQHAVLTSIGLALILVGQPIAWFIRGQLTDGESAIFPAAMVLLGFVMVMGARPFRKIRIDVDPSIVGIYVLLVLLPFVALALVDPIELLTDWTYSLFTIMVILLLAITPLSALRHLPLAIAIVGGISSALPLYELATASALESFVRLTLKGNTNTLVIGTVGGITMLASVLALKTGGARTVLIGVIMVAAFFVGIAAVILSNTRSVMIALVYCFPLLLFVFVPMSKGTFRHPPKRVSRVNRIVFTAAVLGSIVLVPAVAVSLVDEDALESVAETFGERFKGAFSVLSGDEFGVVDKSSRARVEQLEVAMDGLSVGGEGVNAQIRKFGNRRDRGVYPHLTYLQAFYDMGIIGALVFAITNLIVPLALIVKRMEVGQLEPETIFFIIYYLFSHMDHLTHGTPYFWYITMPVALVYVMVPRHWKISH